MEHLAIDLAGRESQICVRSSDGRIVDERRCRIGALPAFMAARPRSRVVVETCSEAFEIADAALQAGHEVRVVPSTLVRSLGVGAGRLKTDRRCAPQPGGRLKLIRACNSVQGVSARPPAPNTSAAPTVPSS
jgi:hypothetical protein